jgi:hypothetical protein
MGKINDLTKDKEIWHLNPLKKEKRNINDGPRWGFFLGQALHRYTHAMTPTLETTKSFPSSKEILFLASCL